jgi:putative phosphoesterase
MRIAILSDIHANLEAFEAVLQSIDSNKPDAVYCLGDLVGYNVWPNEVINEIRKRGIPTIAGNHDAKAKKVWHDGIEGSNYAYSIIGADEMDYLATLPAHIRLEFNLNNEPFSLLMVHGSPYSNKEYLLEEKDETEFISVFKDVNVDMLIFGHTHKPYHRIITDGHSGRNYHAVNVGSVGKPKDGNPKACYALLTLMSTNDTTLQLSLKVEFVRVAYDLEKAAKAIENSPLPNNYASMLRTAD